MFHTQVNGIIVGISEKWTFKAHVAFHETVPLILRFNGLMETSQTSASDFLRNTYLKDIYRPMARFGSHLHFREKMDFFGCILRESGLFCVLFGREAGLGGSRGVFTANFEKYDWKWCIYRQCHLIIPIPNCDWQSMFKIVDHYGHFGTIGRTPPPSYGVLVTLWSEVAECGGGEGVLMAAQIIF